MRTNVTSSAFYTFRLLASNCCGPLHYGHTLDGAKASTGWIRRTTCVAPHLRGWPGDGTLRWAIVRIARAHECAYLVIVTAQ